VIDDNPNICKSLVEFAKRKHLEVCSPYTAEISKEKTFPTSHICRIETEMTVIAPYYPTTAEQHDEKVLLVKQKVGDLKKEDFSDYGK